MLAGNRFSKLKWIGGLPTLHLYLTENNQIELCKFFALSSERKILEPE